MYIYIYMYIYVYTYLHIYVFIHTLIQRVHAPTIPTTLPRSCTSYIFIYTHDVYAFLNMYMHVCKRVYVCICISLYIHVCVCFCVYA